MDEVNEACRMGMKALERTRWIPCSERLPDLKPQKAGIGLDYTGFAATEKGENRMKITLDIPDGMIGGFLNGVMNTRNGPRFVSYPMDSDDMRDGAEIKLPREEQKHGQLALYLSAKEAEKKRIAKKKGGAENG